MAYNLTGIVTNTTGLLSFVQGVNTELTSGWLVPLFFLGFLIVVLTSMIFVTNNFNRSVAATCIIAFTLSIGLRSVDLLSDFIMFACIVLAAAAFAFVTQRD